MTWEMLPTGLWHILKGLPEMGYQPRTEVAPWYHLVLLDVDRSKRGLKEHAVCDHVLGTA